MPRLPRSAQVRGEVQGGAVTPLSSPIDCMWIKRRRRTVARILLYDRQAHHVDFR